MMMFKGAVHADVFATFLGRRGVSNARRTTRAPYPPFLFSGWSSGSSTGLIPVGRWFDSTPRNVFFSAAVSEALPAGMGSAFRFPWPPNDRSTFCPCGWGRRTVGPLFFPADSAERRLQKERNSCFSKGVYPREAGVAAGKDPHLSPSGMVPESGPGGSRLGDGVDTTLTCPRRLRGPLFQPFRRVPGSPPAGCSREKGKE